MEENQDKKTIKDKIPKTFYTLKQKPMYSAL